MIPIESFLQKDFTKYEISIRQGGTDRVIIRKTDLIILLFYEILKHLYGIIMLNWLNSQSFFVNSGEKANDKRIQIKELSFLITKNINDSKYIEILFYALIVRIILKK